MLPPARHSVDGKGALDESKIRTTKTSSISLDNSIPQNSEMSTGQSKHSVESSSEASKQQLQYLIKFQEKKTPGQSNTATKDLLRSDQASYSNSISQKSKKSTGKLQHYNVFQIKRERKQVTTCTAFRG